MKPCVIVGAGGMATEISEWYKIDARNNRTFARLHGYSTNNGQSLEFEKITKLDYLGDINDIENKDAYSYLVCIGEPTLRKKICDKLVEERLSIASYLHSSILISPSSSIGVGCIFYPHVVISSNTKIGDFVVINSYSGIGHDAKVGNYSTISAQVDLAGGVELGNCVFMGSGSRVSPKKKIGNNSKVSAGISIIKNYGENVTILPAINKSIEFKK